MGKHPNDDHTPERTGETDRRGFLKLAGIGTLAGGAAAIAGSGAEAAEAPEAGKGYRDSVHVRAYYDSARF